MNSNLDKQILITILGIGFIVLIALIAIFWERRQRLKYWQKGAWIGAILGVLLYLGFLYVGGFCPEPESTTLPCALGLFLRFPLMLCLIGAIPLSVIFNQILNLNVTVGIGGSWPNYFFNFLSFCLSYLFLGILTGFFCSKIYKGGERKTSPLAISALALGILSLLCTYITVIMGLFIIQLPLSIVAIVLSFKALKKIAADKLKLRGKRLAVGGLILGFISLIFSLLAISAIISQL